MKKSLSGTVLRLAAVLVMIMAVLAAPALLIYQNAQDTIVRELGKNAVNIAATISAFTENNIEKYIKIPISSYELFDDEGGTGSEAGAGSRPDGDYAAFYQELTGIFSTLMETTGAQNIYIERKVSETRKAYMFKSGFQQRSRYLAAILLSENEIRVFENGIPEYSGLLMDDTVGAYISGFAPIKDTNDTVAGIVVVEFSLKYAEDVTNGVRRIVLFSFGAVTLLTAAVINLLIVSRQKYFRKDYLTELCNKSYFEKRLRSAVHMAKAKNRRSLWRSVSGTNPQSFGLLPAARRSRSR